MIFFFGKKKFQTFPTFRAPSNYTKDKKKKLWEFPIKIVTEHNANNSTEWSATVFVNEIEVRLFLNKH